MTQEVKAGHGGWRGRCDWIREQIQSRKQFLPYSVRSVQEVPLGVGLRAAQYTLHREQTTHNKHWIIRDERVANCWVLLWKDRRRRGSTWSSVVCLRPGYTCEHTEAAHADIQETTRVQYWPQHVAMYVRWRKDQLKKETVFHIVALPNRDYALFPVTLQRRYSTEGSVFPQSTHVVLKPWQTLCVRQLRAYRPHLQQLH